MGLLPNHHCHDYARLRRGWRGVARAAALKWRRLVMVDEGEVFWLESAPAGRGEPSLYVSAGVHGDEPGATAGLLDWAARRVSWLRDNPVVLFPCLNPAGLGLNTRTDGRGLDLNRRFHMEDDPVCGPWRQVVSRMRLAAGVCLHEDYDAQGCYLYELSTLDPGWGVSLLARAASASMPVDGRKRIDGRIARHGVIQRRRSPTGLPGMPEAVALYELGCPVTLTFETGSEFSLEARAAAHRRFLDAVIRDHAWRSETKIR
jgi:protein MpaA